MQQVHGQNGWVQGGTVGGEGRALLGILIGFAVISAMLLGGQVMVPQPIRFGGMTIDRLSASLTLLVTAVGAVTFRFSIHYLDGDRRQGQFLRWLALTIGAAFVLMLSTNLLLFFIAWLLISLGLHALLTFYPHRPEAKRPARKKFLISRLGDLALIAAIALIWRDWGTLDLSEFLDAVVATKEGAALHSIGVLIAIAALTKSAQFPFHSWLPETMEAPTPVSALMHAGIINAGGALLLRFSPLMIRLPEVLLLLALVGTLTAALGMVAMWAQVKVKRTLAWSTVSQMGFMMVQCGLGAFPAAAVHIVGHGCYKAWSFLRVGDLPPRALTPTSPVRSLIFAVIGTFLSVPALVIASWFTGFSPMDSPGELALSAVVALSLGQLWAAIFGQRSSDRNQVMRRLAHAIVGTFATAIAAFALYRGSAIFLAPVLGELPPPVGPLAWVAAVVPVVTLMVLMVVHALLPSLGRTRSGRAFHVHALHGFYLGAVADRLVDAVWSHPSPMIQGANHA